MKRVERRTANNTVLVIMGWFRFVPFLFMVAVIASLIRANFLFVALPIFLEILASLALFLALCLRLWQMTVGPIVIPIHLHQPPTDLTRPTVSCAYMQPLCEPLHAVSRQNLRPCLSAQRPSALLLSQASLSRAR